MKIQKRDGRVVPYEEDKIREAIHKANNEVEERYRASEGLIEEILEDVQQEGRQTQTVEHIQDMIEEHLVEHNKYTLAKKYIVYRYQRSLLRKSNTTDESILKLIRNENKELAEENSNKNTRLASTQRDYIAGEVSRDVTRRLLLPEHIAMAHDNGVLHFHDADHPADLQLLSDQYQGHAGQRHFHQRQDDRVSQELSGGMYRDHPDHRSRSQQSVWRSECEYQASGKISA